MSSFQKGLCPLCRVCVQVKNFKRHWHIQHQRNEKKRTYDEVFNTLKSSILDQDKSTTTPSIHTYFEAKKRRVGEDFQAESPETISNQISDRPSPPRISSDISFANNDSQHNPDDDEMFILLPIFEDIFVRLENENCMVHTRFIMNENDGVFPIDHTTINIPNLHPIDDENVIEIDNTGLTTDSVVNVFNQNIGLNEIMSDCETPSSSTISPMKRPSCIKKCLPGVQFITDQELKFIDQQRLLRRDDFWFPDNATGKSKPSNTWFTEKRSIWLRAVCSENKYGLLCVVCAQEAKCESRLKKNKGAFISHPYWKLEHKGLEGTINY